MTIRPHFNEIKSFEDFSKFYWYREELQQICKQLGISSSGTKAELNRNIAEYFKGNIVRRKEIKKSPKATATVLTLDTKLLECDFRFSQKFRDFFAQQTGTKNFKFNADMVATAKKVKEDNDADFTLRDMLGIYHGTKTYAKYDNSSCQWNKFLKDFCADEKSAQFANKLKAASVLWKEVRTSTREKIYCSSLLDEFAAEVEAFRIMQ